MDKEKSTAELVRWNPFADEFFSSGGLFSSPLARFAKSLDELRAARGSQLSPPVDLAEDDKSYAVTIELPGVKKEDVVVELHGNVLTVHGEKKSEREGRQDRGHWLERSYGSFSRSFTLPPTALAEELKAAFKDGVLTIEIPKREPVKAKQIAIK